MIPLVAGFLLQSRWLWALAGVLALVAAGWGAFWLADRNGYQRAKAEWEAADERQRAVDAGYRARLEADYRETVDDAKELLARVRTDAAAADRAAVRLRDAYAGAIARGCPAIAEGGEAAADAARVFADVQRSLEARARALGRIADERGAAGAACEALRR